jgi:hypothetical protein
VFVFGGGPLPRLSCVIKCNHQVRHPALSSLSCYSCCVRPVTCVARCTPARMINSFLAQIAAKDTVLRDVAGRRIYIPPTRSDILRASQRPAAAAIQAQPSVPSIARVRLESSASSASSLSRSTTSSSSGSGDGGSDDTEDDLSSEEIVSEEESSESSSGSDDSADSATDSRVQARRAMAALTRERLRQDAAFQKRLRKLRSDALCASAPLSLFSASLCSPAITAPSEVPRSQVSLDLEKLLACERLHDLQIKLSCV